MNYKSKISKCNQGISLLLITLILSALLVFTLAASNIILRATKTTQEIGESEIAYYAAESAVEEALYAIEKNKDVFGLGTNGTLPTSQGTWNRSITLQNKATTSCQVIKPGFCVNNIPANPDLIIDTIHPLIVTLYDNESFQLDLDIDGFPVGSYPSNIQIKRSGGPPATGGKIIYLDNNGQTTKNLNDNINIDPSQGSKIRLINKAGSIESFEIKPLGNTTLPIGVVITATGTYKDQERIIELERKNWQIY